ncbi:MAG: hypothetical protein FWG14_08930 [Peptococcaceae bacterium]|nr:hypothetical protein [Peptococcaceae bacterium]
MKKIEVDCNFNYIGPSNPALSKKEVESFNLEINEKVTIYQDEDEWLGVVCFDETFPDHYQWYIKILTETFN